MISCSSLLRSEIACNSDCEIGSEKFGNFIENCVEIEKSADIANILTGIKLKLCIIFIIKAQK